MIKKYLLLTIGTISLILGVIGIFLPLLPTTPLILLASFCYLKSSEILYNWLINHKILGKYIHDYVVNKAVKKSAKITAITLLWVSLGITIYLMQISYVKYVLFLIGTAVSIHIFRLKTLPADYK